MKSRKGFLTKSAYLFAGLAIGNQLLWAWNQNGGARCLMLGRIYVGSTNDYEDDAIWAKDHASDFFPADVSIQRAKKLGVAIAQEVLAPSPDTIVFHCFLSPLEFKRFVRGKKRYLKSVQQAIGEYEQTGAYPPRGYPFSKLSWWPPQQTTNLKIWYERDAGKYVFSDARKYEVFVLANASRGR